MASDDQKENGLHPEPTLDDVLVPEEHTKFIFNDEEGEEEGSVTQIDDFSHAGYPLEKLPPGIRGCLSFLEGSEKGRVVRLEKAYSVLGRHATSDVTLRHLSVSSRHTAVFLTRGLEWRVEDLGSKNGTLLNGSLVKSFALRSGDKIFVGDNLILFTVEEDA